MSDDDTFFEPCALTHAASVNGEPMCNTGDTLGNVGTAQNARMYAPCGFWGGPNPAGAGGGAPRGILMQVGNARCVIGAADARELQKLATPLDPAHDRAIISSGATYVCLRGASVDRLEITTAVGDISIAVDNAAKKVTGKAGGASLELAMGNSGPDTATLKLLEGSVAAEVQVGGNALILSYASPAGVTSITLNGAGIVIVSPSSILINGLPLTVP